MFSNSILLDIKNCKTNKKGKTTEFAHKETQSGKFQKSTQIENTILNNSFQEHNCLELGKTFVEAEEIENKKIGK